MNDITDLLRHKELARVDFGSVTIVTPTGRYIDCAEFEKPDHYESRHRYIVEVRDNMFFGCKWVASNLLKTIQALENSK